MTANISEVIKINVAFPEKLSDQKFTNAIGNYGKLCKIIAWLYNIPDYIKLRLVLWLCVHFIKIFKASDSCSDWKHSSLFPLQLTLIHP